MEGGGWRVEGGGRQAELALAPPCPPVALLPPPQPRIARLFTLQATKALLEAKPADWDGKEKERKKEAGRNVKPLAQRTRRQ